MPRWGGIFMGGKVRCLLFEDMVICRIFERMNLALNRCSELVYIELSYYFVPTAVLKEERSGLRD